MTEYRLVSVLVQHLPASGRWTANYRTRWLRAIIRAVDLLVEIESPTSLVLRPNSGEELRGRLPTDFILTTTEGDCQPVMGQADTHTSPQTTQDATSGTGKHEAGT